MSNGYSSGGSWNDDQHWGTKDRFFKALSAAMEKKGWRPVHVPGFDWAALETEHFDIDTLFAAFDADAKQMVEGAHLKLGRWADEQASKMPETRIALAVFDQARPQDVEFITTKLQRGGRMGKQSLSGVVDLATGSIHQPRKGHGAMFNPIRVNETVFKDLQEVVEILAAAA